MLQADRVIENIHQLNPSGRSMVLVSTQSQTALGTRYTSWGKGGWCIGLTALLPYVPIVSRNPGSLNLREPKIA